MRHWILVAVAGALCAARLVSPAGADMERRTHQIIVSQVLRNAETASAGDTIPIIGANGGSIRLRAKMSGSDPTRECDACENPCRSFTGDVTDSAGTGSFYGDVCRESAGASWRIGNLVTEHWTSRSEPAPPPPAPPSVRVRPAPPIIVNREVPAPVPSPELMASIKLNLSMLRYLGDPNAPLKTVNAAIAAFAADAQIEVPIETQAASWLSFNDALAKAVERGKQASCDIPMALRRGHMMCSTLGG